MNKKQMKSWVRRYPLWYLGVMLANLFAIFVLLPYRLWMTHIRKKDVTSQVDMCAYVLYHFTEEIHRPKLQKK